MIEILDNNKINFMLKRYFKNQNCIKDMNMIHHYMKQLVKDTKIGI